MTPKIPEYVVMVPTTLDGYVPPFPVLETGCDLCKSAVWFPMNEEDDPPIQTPESVFLCTFCFVQKVLRNEIDQDSIVHFLGMENWEENEPQFYLQSQQQLDQEMAWAEENLPLICRTAMAVFPKTDDVKLHFIWRTVLLLVWDLLQNRWNSRLMTDQFLDCWSDFDSNCILEFLMWRPASLEQRASASDKAE